jgi:cell division protein FtsW (lipid II flippase)
MATRPAALRWPALAALALPVVAGLAYMAAFDAPRSYLAVNALSLALGAGWIVMGRAPAAATARRVLALVLLALFALPLLTGPQIDGIARWIPAGPVTLHAGLLVLPPLAVLAASDRALGHQLLLAAVLVSLLQPDPASALALACASAGIALHWRDRLFGLVALAGLVASVAAALRGDLPPQPFVEHVIGEAARQSIALALTLLATLTASFILILRQGLAGRAERFALAGTLLGFAGAAMIGNYPTPLVGYGASAILGFVIALGLRSKPVA